MAKDWKVKHKSVYLEIFGNPPINRVLNFLVSVEVFKFDYHLKDIAKSSKVGYSTLKILMPKLVKRKLVEQTRICGKNKMYKLNSRNPTIKHFKKFYWEITKIGRR